MKMKNFVREPDKTFNIDFRLDYLTLNDFFHYNNVGVLFTKTFK